MFILSQIWLHFSKKKTIKVELSHPHSLRLLKELEQVNAIKLLSDNINQHNDLSEWHKKLLDERMILARSNSEQLLDFDITIQELENEID